MKIYSWNVNGIRAAVKKEFLQEVQKSKADLFCVQETKAQDDQVDEALDSLHDYYINTNSAVKKGYSGVSILSKAKPSSVSLGIGIEEHDQEGRVILTDMGEFQLVNVYVPNSGSGLKRLDYRAEWDKAFANYLSDLRKDKPVIITGDFNVAHQPIDLARPKPNYNKTSGYTQVEIDGLSGILDVGFIDSFRLLHPDEIKYTFWSVRFGARAKNIGWRLDYFLVDKRLKDNIKSAEIHDQIMGSDHCPISLEMEF